MFFFSSLITGVRYEIEISVSVSTAQPISPKIILMLLPIYVCVIQVMSSLDAIQPKCSTVLCYAMRAIFQPISRLLVLTSSQYSAKCGNCRTPQFIECKGQNFPLTALCNNSGELEDKWNAVPSSGLLILHEYEITGRPMWVTHHNILAKADSFTWTSIHQQTVSLIIVTLIVYK